MNEVRSTPLTPQLVTSAASSQGITTARSLPPQSGNTLPVRDVPVPEQVEAVIDARRIESTDIIDITDDTEETAALPVETAVTEINNYVQSFQRDLHFSIDEDSGITVVRVRDKESGDLIRQIPEDIFLDLAQKLKEDNTLSLLDAHG